MPQASASSSRIGWQVGAFVLLWFLLVVVASVSGALAHLPSLEPPPLAGVTMLIPMLLYAALPRLREFAAGIGIRKITSIHILRITAAPLFFWYGAHQLLPQVFIGRAAWGDVAAGVLALLAVLWNKPLGYWLSHIAGMLDFVLAFGTAIALTRHAPDAMHAITGLPMALIPFWGVGLLAITHIIAFHLLSRRDSTAKVARAAGWSVA